MNCCVFTSQTDADAYCALAFSDWMATHSDNPDYVEDTTKWAEPAQRLTDGAWFVPACPATDNDPYVVEVSQPDWYPEPDLP